LQDLFFPEALFQVFKTFDFLKCLEIFVTTCGAFCPIESVEGQHAARNLPYVPQGGRFVYGMIKS